MQSRLPSTPMETLSLSGFVGFAVKVIHTFADLFGAWKRPRTKAAGDFEEMSLLDKIYWGYKSKNPLVLPEKGSRIDSSIRRSRSLAPAPPEGFKVTNRLTFAAAGDLIKVDGLEHSKDLLYADIADFLFEKDISYANLESQLTGQDIDSYVFSDKETPPLCCTKEQYNALKGHDGERLTLLHTACNHTLDMGPEGVETTLAQLRKDQIVDLGTNRGPFQQQRGRIVEKNGIKLGFVSATFGLNGKPVPEGKEWLVNVVKFHALDPGLEGVDLGLLERQIEECRKQKCDIIMASLHWGFEYEFFPRRRQVELAHKIIEAGVDVIVAHHSHVLQPVEFYRPQRDPSRTAVIAYSLGNLTSNYSAPHLVLSGLLDLVIVKGEMDGETRTMVAEAALIPVVQRDIIEDDRPVVRIERLEEFLDRMENEDNKRSRAYGNAIKRYAERVL
jgi:poly-gamma-glutamate synthesis protein (capsule biosynthesis protein)